MENPVRRSRIMSVSRWSAAAVSLALSFLPPQAGAQDIVEAAKAGRLDRVEAILASDPGAIDTPDPSGYTALRWAGIRGHRAVLLLLTDSGADPNTVGADGGTPLHGAAHHDDSEMVRALLAAGGDISVRNQWGRTPLHVAARRGCLAVAKLLLDAGADPNATTNEGWSTLTVAHRGGHQDLVELLLSRGADPDLMDSEGRRPGDVTLIRPSSVAISRRQADELVGHYDLGDGFGFDVWREGDRIRLREFAPDDLLPVAPDTFYAAREPWRAVFIRGGDGVVDRLQVDFLRQTVVAERVRDPSRGIQYVGAQACLGCHSSGPGDGPAGHWIASRHSRAFHTLSSDQAKRLVAEREEYRDITDPSLEQRCLMCHVTAAQNPMATLGEGFSPVMGVGCESCHGPGSAYMEPAVMGNREAFLANGGRMPDELTCRECHRDEAFRFAERLERIRHWE
jgi:ankyrin repeat protein